MQAAVEMNRGGEAVVDEKCRQLQVASAKMETTCHSQADGINTLQMPKATVVSGGWRAPTWRGRFHVGDGKMTLVNHSEQRTLERESTDEQ